MDAATALRRADGLSPEEAKACCASAYASEAARWLLGDTHHPGGARLTRVLIDALGAGPGHTVIDVASGPGASARQAASESGCDVIGVELSRESVERARQATLEAGLADRVSFVVGDAEALPLQDESADGILCECSLCIFPHRDAALAEFRRVLRPGARAAISDVTATAGALPDELKSVAAWVSCLGAAEPLDRMVSRLEREGLHVERAETHDDALAELVNRVEARLRVARAAPRALPALVVEGVERGLELTRLAKAAVDAGDLGYAVVIASRP